MSKEKKSIPVKKGAKESPFKFYWTKMNYIFFALGFVVLILGYFLLSTDPWDGFTSLSLSPVVLLIAYIIIFPLSILFIRKKKN
jgi:hypothetical protein